MADKEQNRPTSSWLVCWLGFGGLVWLLLGVFILLIAKPEAGCVDLALYCLTAGDWGSYLSGIFAPLAFGGLIATIWIQRDELILTRKEFVHNREVMQAQADEAKNQANLMAEQTRIILQREADREFEAHLTFFRNWAMKNLGRYVAGSISASGNVAQADVGYFTKSMPSDDQDFFIELLDRLNNACANVMFSGHTEAGAALAHIDLHTYRRLIQMLTDIDNLRDRVSPSVKAILKQTSIDQVKALLRQLQPAEQRMRDPFGLNAALEGLTKDTRV